jgi:hypothetical protein
VPTKAPPRKRAPRGRRVYKPFTVDHLRRYSRLLILENGKPFELESFQLDFASDLFTNDAAEEFWFVVPEGNGKTTFLALLGLYHCDYTESAFVPIGASSATQAEILYRQGVGFVVRSRLERRFICQDGYRRINGTRLGGRIQVYAADDKTGDGLIPTLVLLDELHRHRDLRLYRTWRGKLDKRNGKLAAISTAGEPGSEFEETRDRIIRQATKIERKGPRIRAESHGVVIHDWAVRDRKKCSNMAEVAKANPRKAITAARIRKKRETPTMTDDHFLRFVCNIATRISGQAINQDVWDALKLGGHEVSDEARRFGWMDMAWSIDTTAVGVLIWESQELRYATGVKVIQPPVDQHDVAAAIIEVVDDWRPECFVYDPTAGGQQMVQLLEAGDHPLQAGRGGLGSDFFVNHSQDNAPMSLASRRFDEAMRMKWFQHDGDRDLRTHALNSVRKNLGGEKWKYDRPADARGSRRSKYPIDALTGVLMGHSIAVDRCQGAPEPVDLLGYRIQHV